MANIKKKLTAFAVCTVMMTSVASISASANTVSKNGVGSFSWGSTYSKIVNKSKINKRVEAFINVYEDGTGKYVTGFSANATGGYDTYAQAKNSKYSRSGYNFECWGYIYNSTSTYSGVAWATGIKNID